MSKSPIELGVVDAKGTFHPHSSGSDLSSAIATATLNAKKDVGPFKLATRDRRTGKVTVHGTFRPASNPIARG